MSEMTAATGTPVVSVRDNRGIPVRTLNWNRESAERNAAEPEQHGHEPERP